MNYIKIYENLINRGKNRILDGYTEEHHIIPRCMGGNDEESNLVELTPEEHYVAHQLLVKIHPENDALVSAAVMMIPNRPSNKLYGWLRRRFSDTQSRNQTGDGNSQFGTKWILNRELQVSKKIPVSDELPYGWELGRIMDKWAAVEFDDCPICGKRKEVIRKFCSHSCSATNRNTAKVTIFDLHLEDMIKDYSNGMSVYKCLISRGLCGTGSNHTILKKEIKNRGIV